jgi:cyclopropane-fatty-acyl-phospholipid synthase
MRAPRPNEAHVDPRGEKSTVSRVRSGADYTPPPDRRPADASLTHSRHVVDALFGTVAERTFDVRYWDGTIDRGLAGSSRYSLVVSRPGALRAMLLPPSELSIVEAFISGDVDVEGDLEAAVSIADQVNARIRSPRTLATVMRHLLALPRASAKSGVQVARAERVVKRWGREHEPSRDQAAIRYHYDVGNDFYQLWLDQRMVYSCAYFESATESLDDAQAGKLDLVCRKLGLRAGQRFLDVGCGWGALVLHAAQNYGVTALGITLSEAQASLARERIAKAGLDDRCRIEIRDYRHLPKDAQFDRIASVGMVEHVGLDKLPAYFSSLYDALVPGGRLLNHGIVSVHAAREGGWRDWLEGKLWRRNAFIEQYVFPDARLVPLHDVIRSAEAAGFETRDVESLREHYAMTLRAWLSRLTANAAAAIAATDLRTYRTWRLYMTGSAHAFSSGRINVVQTLLAKPDAAGRALLPLTRESIYGRPPNSG